MMEKRHVRIRLQPGRSFSDVNALEDDTPPEKVAILRRHLIGESGVRIPGSIAGPVANIL